MSIKRIGDRQFLGMPLNEKLRRRAPVP